ncbi:IS3 family transposase [Brevibacillus laterosporus]|uniref:IS3 family transposase n=1 Tax=Brevibacillus laterosporus TaxID=1465 RepID=UPI003556EA98
MIKDAYVKRDGILGYRQMTIKLNRQHNLTVNHKRIYRLMCILQIKSYAAERKRITFLQRLKLRRKMS